MNDYERIIDECVKAISIEYPKSLIIKGDYSNLKEYIQRYLDTKRYPKDLISNSLITDIYNELAKYSFLTKYIEDPCVDEININSYSDIFVSYSKDKGGKTVKINERFHSKEHALSIVRRLLSEKGNVIDYSNPISSSYIETENGNIRITSILPPLIPKEDGICASIRLLHPKRIDTNFLLDTNYMTPECNSFLQSCIKYGCSIIIAGKTNSGKTTCLSSILSQITNDKRIFVIEEGAREIFGKEHTNDNIISTLTRHTNKGLDIKQEDLLFSALRFNPDIIALGEMRTEEAHACIEASLTGHTVISTIHSGPGENAHMRMSLLMQRKFPIDIHMSIKQARLAFPIVVYSHMFDDGHRHITNIQEYDDKNEKYVTLFSYDLEKDTLVKTNDISYSLYEKMKNFGFGKEI